MSWTAGSGAAVDGAGCTRRSVRKSGGRIWNNSSPNELTNDQREYLLGLPPAEMDEQLEQMYMRSQVGLRDDDFLRRFWRGRGPRGGRGRDRDRGPRRSWPARRTAREFDRERVRRAAAVSAGRAGRAEVGRRRRDHRRAMDGIGVRRRRTAWDRRRMDEGPPREEPI